MDRKQRKVARQCVLCGKCLEVCPIFAATGREEFSPRAKFFLARTLADKKTQSDISKKRALKLAGKCFSCGKCEKACPARLCAPDLLCDLRAANPDAQAALWRLWVEKAHILWPMMTTLSRILPDSSPGGRIQALSAGLKAMALQPLDPWLLPTRFDACGQGRKAVVFSGCVAAHAQPRLTAAAEKLLRGLGFAVAEKIGFVCCGYTLGHVGLKDAQRRMRLINLASWRKAGRPLIVSFCATCRYGLSRYVRADLDWLPGEREMWAAALVPLSELASHVEYAVLPGNPAGKVHYHTPCHDTDGKDAVFLRAVLGDALYARTQKDMCCGFGGALKLDAPELSDIAAKRCLDFYGPLPSERILSGCSGCVMQLRANAPDGVRVGHWLESVKL